MVESLRIGRERERRVESGVFEWGCFSGFDLMNLLAEEGWGGKLLASLGTPWSTTKIMRFFPSQYTKDLVHIGRFTLRIGVLACSCYVSVHLPKTKDLGPIPVPFSAINFFNRK